MLSLYRALIRLRGNEAALSVGAFRLVHVDDHVLAYERRIADQRLLIALNMTDRVQVLRPPRPACEALLSTYLDHPDPLRDDIHLRADEGLILRALPDVA